MFKDWKSDLLASMVVFLVALPLCLGIALASNAPLASGLFAGIIGGMVIGFLSDSHVSVSGPAAGLTVIVINGISQLGSFEAFTLAVFLSGIFQIIFGFLRAGLIGNYFPTAVIRGMLAAIGLILILKQYPNTIVQPGAVIISLFSLALMLTWDKFALKGLKFFRLIPGALIAVLLSIALNGLFKIFWPELALGSEHLVKIPTGVFSLMQLPDFSRITDYLVLQTAITIAIVASLETLLCVDAAEKIDPQRRATSKNRELWAQGVGNALSGLIGGLPLTAVIVRTSANLSAGGRTKLSTILHGAWLLGAILLIPGFLNLIPLASLACVLLLVGYKLCKPMHFFDMKKRGWDQLFIFCATIVAILASDLLWGILLGMILALLIEINKYRKNPYDITHGTSDTVIEFNDSVSFVHKARIKQEMKKVSPGKTLYIKNFSGNKLHVDVYETILDQKEELEKNQITVILC